MPLVFSPDCVFIAKTPKTLLKTLKIILTRLYEDDGIRRPELVNWRSKYVIEVLDAASCSIELVQIEGM